MHQTTDQNTTLEFSLESLEDRKMLAGDVEVRVTGGGDLVINGDNQKNVINVKTLANGDFRVAGFDGTTINGQANQIFSGVTDDLRINLRSGDDILVLEDTRIADDLNANMGNGSDTILISTLSQAVTVGDDFRINTGDGNDEIFSTGSFATIVVDDMSIRTGSGQDEVDLTNLTVADRTNINMGSDDDFVVVSQVSFNGRSTFNLGGGNDEILVKVGSYADSRINGGGGDDRYIDSNNSEFDIRNIETIDQGVC